MSWSEKQDPLSDVPVETKDDVEDVSELFRGVYISLMPKSNQTCVGSSGGGGVCGDRVRQTPSLPTGGGLDTSCMATAPNRKGRGIPINSTVPHWLGSNNVITAADAAAMGFQPPFPTGPHPYPA